MLPCLRVQSLEHVLNHKSQMFESAFGELSGYHALVTVSSIGCALVHICTHVLLVLAVLQDSVYVAVDVLHVYAVTGHEAHLLQVTMLQAAASPYSFRRLVLQQIRDVT